MRHELLRVISVSEKTRSGQRLRFKVHVEYRNGLRKTGMGVCISKTEKDAIDKAEVTAARSCFKSPVMDDGNSEVLENKDTFSIYRTTESNIFWWNHRLTSCWVLLLAGVKHCIAEGNTPKLHENISMATLNALKYNWHFFLYCFFLNNYPREQAKKKTTKEQDLRWRDQNVSPWVCRWCILRRKGG